jgi:hypothetical protein
MIKNWNKLHVLISQQQCLINIEFQKETHIE